MKRGGERRKVGWTCTILHSIPRHFYVAAFAPVLLDAFSFFALTLFARFLFFAHARLLSPSLSRSRRRALEDESRSAGRSRTRNVATANLHASPVTGERNEIHLVFCKDSSSYCRSLKFRRFVSLTTLCYGTTACDPNQRAVRLPSYPFVAGLTDKITSLRSNNIHVRSFRDPPTTWRYGNPIINDIRAKGWLVVTCLGHTFYLLFLEGLAE